MRNHTIAILFGASLAIGTPALAQSQKGVVRGIAGVTFGTETSTVYAGGFGVNVAPNVQITGEFGRMETILPKMRNDADEGVRLTEEFALRFFRERVDVEVDVVASAFYGMGGARFVAPTTGRARPYVGGSVGFAHVTPSIGLTLDGEDVTQDVIDGSFIDRFERVSKLLMMGDGASTLDPAS